MRGTVRITLPIDAGDAFIAEMFADFQLEHPGVRVEAHFSNRYVDLVEEGFDLALRAGKLGDSSLVSRKIAESEFALFASPAYLARRGTPESLAELEAHDCLIFERMRDWSLQGPKGLETVRPAGDRFVVLIRMAFLTLMAGTGLGIALLPIVNALGATFGRDPPSHVRILPEYVQRSGGLSLLWPASPGFIPVRVALLRDHLTERLRSRYATCAEALVTGAKPPAPPAPSGRPRPEARPRPLSTRRFRKSLNCAAGRVSAPPGRSLAGGAESIFRLASTPFGG